MDKILKQIELLRRQLRDAANNYDGITEGEILRISQELDEYIVKYHRLVSSKREEDYRRLDDL